MNPATDSDEQTQYEYDKELLKGPKRIRRCTDITFCSIFIAFSAFGLFWIIHCLIKGDLTRIALPTDRNNHSCGKVNKSTIANLNTDYTSFPYLYIDPATIQVNPS